MIIGDPNELAHADQLWVFLSIDERGFEGVCGTFTSIGWMPLVTANPRTLERLRPIAQQIAQESGKRVRLVRFTSRVEETLDA